MNDRARFASAMASLAAALPLFGREFTTKFQEVYWHALADLSDEDFEAAAMRCLRELKQFPTPSDLLERARPKGDDELAGARLFLSLLRQPRYHPVRGDYWDPDEIERRFGRAARAAFTVAGGTVGFRAACDPEKERFIRRDFVSTFRRVVADDPTAARPDPVPELPNAQPLRELVSIVGDGMRLPSKRVREKDAEVERKRDGFRTAAQQGDR